MLEQLALEYAKQDYNCAESILHAANEYYHLNLTDQQMKLVGGFGGGMQCGDICGTLAASISVISVRYIEIKAHEDKPRLRQLVNLLIQQFQQEMGSRRCVDIKPKYYTKEIKCNRTIEKAAALLEKVIAQIDEQLLSQNS